MKKVWRDNKNISWFLKWLVIRKWLVHQNDGFLSFWYRKIEIIGIYEIDKWNFSRNDIDIWGLIREN